MTSKKRVFFSGLNEMRAIAALAVVFHHIELYKKRLDIQSLYDFGSYIRSFINHLGNNGVLLFFVLSGFLITYLLLEEKHKTGSISVPKFYGRRMLRIWPLYFVIVVVGFCIVPLLYFNFPEFFKNQEYYNSRIEDLVYGNNLLLHVLFLSNIALLFFSPVAGAAQSWSVSVEEQFYLIWPWVVKLCNKNLLLALLSIIFLTNFFKKFFPESLITTYFIHSRVDIMSMGGVIAYLYRSNTNMMVKFIKNHYVLFLLIISLMLHLVFSISSFTKSLTFGLLLVSCIEYGFKVKILSSIGKLSYGVYMYHPLMMYISFALLDGFYTENLVLLNFLIYSSVLGLTFLMSYISYNYLELFFLKLKRKVSPVLSGNNYMKS